MLGTSLPHVLSHVHPRVSPWCPNHLQEHTGQGNWKIPSLPSGTREQHTAAEVFWKGEGAWWPARGLAAGHPGTAGTGAWEPLDALPSTAVPLLRLPTLEFSFAPVIKQTALTPLLAPGCREDVDMAGRGEGWESGSPQQSGLWDRKSCSHSSSALPNPQSPHPHCPLVLSSTMNPVPDLEHPRMSHVPPGCPMSPRMLRVPGHQGLGWLSELADGNNGSGSPETAVPCSDGASRAVRGINAHRRFIFLSVGMLSQHRAAPLWASRVTLHPGDTAPWGPPGSAHP